MQREHPAPCIAVGLCSHVKRAVNGVCGTGVSVWRTVSSLGCQPSREALGPHQAPQPSSAGRSPHFSISTSVHTWLKCCIWDCCDISGDRVAISVTLFKAFSPLPPSPCNFRALGEDAANVGRAPHPSLQSSHTLNPQPFFFQQASEGASKQ